jgi:hypothetical protein
MLVRDRRSEVDGRVHQCIGSGSEDDAPRIEVLRHLGRDAAADRDVMVNNDGRPVVALADWASGRASCADGDI